MRISAVRKLALALVGLALFAVVDVSLGRLRAARIARALEKSAPPAREYRVSHPYYHHDLAPSHATDSAFWGPIQYSLRTNTLGFRDADTRDIPRHATAYRILLMGDSFTEGLGIDFQFTFAGLLATRYAPAGIEVLNGGVASYSPAIYWKKIEYLLSHERLEVNAIVVFLDISDIHDEALSYRLDSIGRVVDVPEPRPGLMSLLERDSLTYRAVAKAIRTVHPHPPLVGCTNAVIHETPCRAGWTLSHALMERYGREGLRLADEHMTSLAALLRARHVPLTIVVYPWPQQIEWNDRASLQISYWTRWAQREGAQFIDLFKPFFAEVDALGVRQAIRQYFIPDDYHWNARGHQLVAEHFARGFATEPGDGPGIRR